MRESGGGQRDAERGIRDQEMNYTLRPPFRYASCLTPQAQGLPVLLLPPLHRPGDTHREILFTPIYPNVNQPMLE
jgi:hypothetical protein